METNSISRVNYFNGEALLTADFKDEQRYHIEMRERFNRGLLSSGILDGLDVEWTFGSQAVTVRAGQALDGKGQLIALTQDATATLSNLVDGPQNYLTISYAESGSEFTSTAYGEGYKRWIQEPSIACSQDYDPAGTDVLLAIVSAQGGGIQHVYYFHGDYRRQRVSAALQSVAFVDGADSIASPGPMSIGAVGNGILAVTAPRIELNGVVTAGTPDSQFEGRFNGAFAGDGSGLTGVPFPEHAGYWKRNDSDGSLFYTEGCVGVNVTEPTAVLTVGQSVLQEIGVGLVTAVSSDNGIVTLQGYQTNFTDALEGKILQFGVVLKQEATIASVDSDETLTLSKSFPLGLGPTSFGYKRGEFAEVTDGNGKITPDGVTVHGSGTQFLSQLKAGDTLVIDRFVPDSKVHESKIDTSKTITDTLLTLTEAFSEDVTDSGYLYGTVAGRWISGVGTLSSNGKQVTGTGTKFTALPHGATLRAIRALEVVTVPQTWRVDAVADATHLTMRKISIDEGSPVVPMMSAFAITTWPLMKVGGDDGLDIAPALTVVQNNGSVPNTVAINVDDENVKIDSTYALQVNGPVSLTSLDVDEDLTVEGDLTVDGDLTVTGTATIERMLTSTGGLTVADGATMDTLDVTDTNGTALKVAGTASITTLDATTVTASDATVTTLNVTETSGTGLTVGGLAKINTLEVTSTSANPALKVDGTLATDGALTVSNSMAKAGAVINGDLMVNGKITASQQAAPGNAWGTSTLLKSVTVALTGGSTSDPKAYSGKAPENGMVFLTSNNGLSKDMFDSVTTPAWYSCLFSVMINNSEFSSNSMGFTFGYGWGTAQVSAFVCAPVNKGDDIVLSYVGMGATCTISANLVFVPLNAG